MLDSQISPISSATPEPTLGELLAWCAGMIDGEGCLHIARQTYTSAARRHRPTYVFRLSIGQSDYLALLIMLRVLGGNGRIYPVKRRRGMNKQPYVLVFSGPSAYAALRRVHPHLRVKKAQADMAFEFEREGRINEHRGPQGQLPEIWALRERYYRKLQRMK